jgi:uncharacterized protein (DUF2236 family)
VSDHDGLLPPDSPLRLAARETVGLLYGVRTLMLQLAHPLIMAGVDDHSNYRADPLLRLQGTLDIMNALVFGTRRQALDALHQYYAIHARVRGRLGEGAGPYAAGTPYAASDPELRLWVAATLIESTLAAHERFVAPLAAEEREPFYADARVIAAYLGVPESRLPASLGEFQAYFDEMLASDRLQVTPAARAAAAVLLNPPVWFVPRLALRVMRFITPGLLPERLRRDYGMDWGPGRERALVAFARFSRAVVPLLPATVRYMPEPGGTGFLTWAIGKRKTAAGGRGRGAT